ncbi:hypothetical protein DFJ73DRAFT_870837 [Zopfochytrium polystomum]|nr:hypothetical protein DFJ73DRAFT_870837 [Zopfochytrium polystomum]
MTSLHQQQHRQASATLSNGGNRHAHRDAHSGDEFVAIQMTSAHTDYAKGRASREETVSRITEIVHQSYIRRCAIQNWTPHAENVLPYPEKPSFFASAGAALRKFAFLLYTNGIETGEEADVTAVPGDVLRKELEQAKESVWSVLVKEKCTPNDLLQRYNRCNGRFKATNGYDMYLERGVEGENILQYALLVKNESLLNYFFGLGEYDPGINSEIQPFPKHVLAQMINSIYEGSKYWGEHACHLAVVNFGDDPKWLKILIKHGADCHIPRARGAFFSLGGTLYMGETVLSFAACMGHRRIVKYLLNEVGVDPLCVDGHGNTVLHVLAYWGYYSDARAGRDKPTVKGYPRIEPGSIYDIIARSSDKKEKDRPLGGTEIVQKLDEVVINSNKETPLILAVRNNQVDMVKALIIYKESTLWTYGPMSMHRIPLTELDTVFEEATMTHKTSALNEAIRSNKVDVIRIHVFDKLLEAKWILYGRRIFLFSFVQNILYLLLFSAMIWMLPNDQTFYNADLDEANKINNGTSFARYGSDARLAYYDVFKEIFVDHQWDRYHQTQVARLCIELLLVICNVWAVKNEMMEIIREKWVYFTGFSRHQNYMQWVNITLFFLGVILRFSRNSMGEDIVWGWNAIFGWLYLLYFSKGFYNFGLLSNLSALCIVFVRIIQLDLFTFIALVAIFIVGLGQAMWLFMGPVGDFAQYVTANQNITGQTYPEGLREWKSLPGGMLWAIRYFFGQGSYDDVRNANSSFALVIYLVFNLVVNLLLVNVFIAMIGSRFSQVLEESNEQARMSWANLIMETDEIINARYAQQSEHLKRREQRERKKHMETLTRLQSNFVDEVSRSKSEEDKERIIREHAAKVKLKQSDFEELLNRLRAPHLLSAGNSSSSSGKATESEEIDRQLSLQPITRMGIPRKTQIFSGKIAREKKGGVKGNRFFLYDFLFEVVRNETGVEVVRTVATVDESSPLIALGQKGTSSTVFQRKLSSWRDDM